MKKQAEAVLFAILFSVAVSGCATWQYISQSRQWTSACLEAALPAGWVKYNNPGYLLFLTRDGILLENITIRRQDFNKEFLLTKKKIKEDMLIQDIATLISDEMALDKSLGNLEILENKPARIGGKDCFKLVYTFYNKDSVRYKAVTYGFTVKKNYYEVNYLAAYQHYFEKNLPDFEMFINSFKVIGYK